MADDLIGAYPGSEAAQPISVDRSGPLRRLRAIDSGTRAQDLHERAFGEKSQIDWARLSLEENKALAQRSAQIASATIARAKYEDTIRRNLSAAAATQSLMGVDKTSGDFDKHVADIVSKYPESIQSPGFLQQLTAARADRKLYQQAEATRTAATFNNPVVAKSYQDSLDKLGDPRLAQIQAKATEETFNKAKSLATNTQDLSTQDRTAVLGILHSGDLNSAEVQKQLTDLELKANTAKSERDAATPGLQHVTALTNAISHMQKLSETSDSPELQDTIKQGQNVLASYVKMLKPAGAPAETPSAGDDAVSKYLGQASSAASSAATGAGLPQAPSPAVTPSQSAAEETEPSQVE